MTDRDLVPVTTLRAGASSRDPDSPRVARYAWLTHGPVALYSGAMFLNALLLFLVQPTFAKLLLPILGGAPSVWTTCMLFFQCGLLAGYFYSHALDRLLSVRRQAVLHVAVLGAAGLVLPVGIPGGSVHADADPVWWVLRVAAVSVGAPFFALATSAPLLQRWFSRLRHHSAADPYFLYVASNAGSLAALVLYPVVLEPTLAGTTQAIVWATAYVTAGLLTLGCAVLLWRAPARPPQQWDDSAGPATPVVWRRRLRWIGLSFVPSSLMLAVTAYLSADVAPVPLMWIVPLALYLVTFIVTFSRFGSRVAPVAGRLLPFAVLSVVWLLVTRAPLPLVATALLHLFGFFVVAILCHGALAADRPAPKHLTDFYLALAVGGALGGVFNTLIAPRLFTEVWEYPLVVGIACIVLGVRRETGSQLGHARFWRQPAAAGLLTALAFSVSPGGVLHALPSALLFGVALVVCFSASRELVRFGTTVVVLLGVSGVWAGAAWGDLLYSSRTFFGVYRVAADPAGQFVTLFSGTTVHGRQRTGDPRPEPLAYYHRESPVADVLNARSPDAVKWVGAVGLGVGSVAAYAQPDQRWRFYEIDPEVERIARDGRYFNYLSACGGACDVVLGDARVSLARGSETYDVIVLDAFSSDAIPVHLLTREAIATYLTRLAPDGIMAFHISNNHLRLRPVLSRLSRAHALAGRARIDHVPDDASGRSSSEWVVLARRATDLGRLLEDRRWEALAPDSHATWTDDFSNIWTVLDWHR